MKRIFLSLLVAAAVSPVAALIGSGAALADDHPVICNDGSVQYSHTGGGQPAFTAAQACAAHKGVAKDQSGADQKAADAIAAATPTGPCGANQVQIAVVFPGGSHCVDNSQPGGAIIAYLKVLLAYLASLVGSVVILMIIIGGVQYITSAGDPAQIKKAKERIVNAVIALVLFLSAFAILSFIIPGGILV
jgi:hypothetical protein